MVDYGDCEMCKKEIPAGRQMGIVDSAGMSHSYCPDCYKIAVKKEFGEGALGGIIERKDSGF